MKKDIKYIIKKIIIGIGITIGVILIKPHLSYAYELNNEQNITLCQTGRSGNTFGWSTTGKSCSVYYGGYDFSSSKFTEYNSHLLPFNNNVRVHFNREGSTKSNYITYYDKAENVYIYYSFRNIDSKYKNFKIQWDEKNGYYTFFISTATEPNNWENASSYGASLALITPNLKSKYDTLYQKHLQVSGSDSVKREKYTFNDKDFYIYHIVSPSGMGYLYKYYKNNGLDGYFDFKNNDFKLMDKSFDNLYHEDLKQDYYNPDKVDIPSHYQTIDMFNKYAVLLYPKDFRNIPTECTKAVDRFDTDSDGNVTVVPNGKCKETSYLFKFWYTGYFHTAYSDLQVMNVVVNPVEQLPLPASADPYYLPLYKNVNDFKGAILFYNDNLAQHTDSDGNVTTYYDKGTIWYDPTLYNYFYVEDYDTQPKEDITYVDKDGNEQHTTITNIPNKNTTKVDEAKPSKGLFDDFKTNDHGLSSIITSPLNFVKNLTSASCTALFVPIPFSKNQSISLPCLTPIYESKASAVYNLYKTIIIGITGYWVCVRIYALVKGFKDPDDDKIEVMDL